MKSLGNSKPGGSIPPYIYDITGILTGEARVESSFRLRILKADHGDHLLNKEGLYRRLLAKLLKKRRSAAFLVVLVLLFLWLNHRFAF